MRAWLVEAPGPVEGPSPPLRLADLLPVPRPAEGEALVRVEACGICHTDLHVAEGDLRPSRLPIVPGHQVVGEVVEVGAAAAAAGIAAGDRVGIAWLRSTCGACRFCTSGRENLCKAARFTGYDADGGFAEYTTVPAAFAYRLPEGLPPLEAAPLLCAGLIGYRALGLAAVPPGGRLGLFGFGAAAHLTIQVARHLGLEVSVFTRSAAHAALARSLGAAWTGRAEEAPPAPLCGAVIFAPAGSLVPHALRAVDRGGTVVLAGIHMTAVPPLDYGRDLYFERVLRSVTANTRADAEAFLRLAAEVPVRAEVEPVPFAEAPAALARLKRGEVRGAAVLDVAGRAGRPAGAAT